MKYIAAIIAVSLYSPAFAQRNAGFIDANTILLHLEGYKTRQVEIEKYQRALIDSFNNQARQFERYVEGRGCGGPVAESKSIQDSVNQVLRNLEDFGNSIKPLVTSLKNRTDKEFRTILARELTDFVKIKNISLLTEENKILYCSDCINYTDEFIDYLEVSYTIRNAITKKYKLYQF